MVGIGAVKYADLSQNRTSDYVFSWAKMLAMNGNTATYMQYAYARNRSIFRKGDVDADTVPAQRRRLPFWRRRTSGAGPAACCASRKRSTAAAADYQPSAITAYLWDLAKTYSGFFQNCPVLKAADARAAAKPAAVVRPDGPGDPARAGPARHSHGRADVRPPGHAGREPG